MPDVTESEVRTLTFLVSLDDELMAPAGEKGIFTPRDSELQLRPIPVASLRESLQATLNGLNELFQGLDKRETGLPIKEVQISFEVTANGKVAILGTSAELGAKGAITIIFGR